MLLIGDWATQQKLMLMLNFFSGGDKYWKETTVARWHISLEAHFTDSHFRKRFHALSFLSSCLSNFFCSSADGTYWQSLCLSAAGSPSSSECSLMHLITSQAKRQNSKRPEHTNTEERSFLGPRINTETLQWSNEDTDIGKRNVLLTLTT